jgi:hypothetical protein
LLRKGLGPIESGMIGKRDESLAIVRREEKDRCGSLWIEVGLRRALLGFPDAGCGVEQLASRSVPREPNNKGGVRPVSYFRAGATTITRVS